MFGILYHGTKLEANAHSVLNHYAEEKRTQNSVPWNKNISRHLDFCSEHSAEETTTRNFVPKHVSEENMLSILFDGAGFFVKQTFFMTFPSVPSFGIDSYVNLGMSTFFRRITEVVPSLFRGIFSERNSVANPTYALAPPPPDSVANWPNVRPHNSKGLEHGLIIECVWRQISGPK